MFASPFPTAAEIMRLTVRSSVMLSEAQMVMSLRLMGMAGLWPVAKAETSRMVTEKLDAMQEANMAAFRAICRGAGPVDVAEAVLRPVRKRTRANAARLSKRAG